MKPMAKEGDPAECTRCQTKGAICFDHHQNSARLVPSTRNRCRSECIVMGFTFLVIIVVILVHFNFLWIPLRADHIGFSPPVNFVTQNNVSSLVQAADPASKSEESSALEPVIVFPGSESQNNSSNQSKNQPMPSVGISPISSNVFPITEVTAQINGTKSNGTKSNVTETLGWIEKKLKSYDPQFYTKSLVATEKMLHWVNSSVTLSIVTPLILGSTAGILLVLLVMYHRHLLFCLFHCLTCGCISCYCRSRRKRQNYELGLKGKFFDKSYDEPENHYLLVPKKEDEAVDVDEDSDTELEIYSKQKVNV